MTAGKILKRIMYIDDDPDLLDIVSLGLKMGDFTVKLCNSGREALDQIEVFQPDLLMVDMMMPDMNGTKTLEAIHELPEFQEVPAIFLTAKVNKKQLMTYKELGAIGVINKPMNPLKLAGVVLQIWNKQ